jgi:hypothetical protein
MYKNEGLCPRRDKKKRKTLEKLIEFKTKLKKKKGEPEVKPDIVLDAILLRRRPSGLTSCPKKKAKFEIEKEVARRTRTQKIKK